MSSLSLIEDRHRGDHWKDAGFIVIAALLAALSVGAISSRAAGKPTHHEWKLTVIEDAFEIAR